MMRHSAITDCSDVRPASAPAEYRSAAASRHTIINNNNNDVKLSRPADNSIGNHGNELLNGCCHDDQTKRRKLFDETAPLKSDNVQVYSETAIASVISGILRDTATRCLVYKCHFCHAIFASLAALCRHMSAHDVKPSHETSTAAGTQALQRSVSEQLSTSCGLDFSIAKSRGSNMCNGFTESASKDNLPSAGSSPVSVATSSHSSAPSAVSVTSDDLSRSSQQQRRSRPLSGRRRATTDTIQCRRPSQRLAYVSSEMLAGDEVNTFSSVRETVGQLASEIRAKEHLDDDVTVVIPSDAPLDPVPHHTGTAAADDPDDLSMKPRGSTDSHIAHVPVRSIMGHSQRKTRVSVSGTDASTDDAVLPVSESSASVNPLAAAQQLSLLNVAAESLQFPGGGLPAMFGPLALSTFVHGFGGLVAAASPFLSYYTQTLPNSAGMASLMAVAGGNAAASSPLVTTTAAAAASADDAKGVAVDASDAPPADSAAVASGSMLAEETSNGSGSSGWAAEGAGFASPNVKCSSLSRTHSRLNVVRRPIKREDACRPVVLSDGRTAFRCFYCKKDFCTISDVNRHMDFHEDIRPYKCRFCNYYARTNSQLKVHMMRHQGIREYMCRLCNYKGVTQSDLNRHTKSQIHLMKARNECGQCAEGFVSPTNLQQHQHDQHQLTAASSSTH